MIERRATYAFQDLSGANAEGWVTGDGMAINNHIDHDASGDHAVLHACAIAELIRVLPPDLVGGREMREFHPAFAAAEVVVELIGFGLVEARPSCPPRTFDTFT